MVTYLLVYKLIEEIMAFHFQLIPLHSRLDLIPDCVSLLATEWPKGKYERLEVMESHCPNPPCSLAFLMRQSDGIDVVIGHCRILPIKDMKDTVYLEQVVIQEKHRNKGYGKTLMAMAEEYCVNLGYKKTFLQTNVRDRVPFYIHLGYKFTDVTPTVIGSVMLDYTTQIPRSTPCPGFEHFHTPYNGEIPQQTIHLNLQTSEQKENNNMKDTTMKNTDNVQIPSWAVEYWYCNFVKELA